MVEKKRNIPRGVPKDLNGWMVDMVGTASRKKHKSDTKHIGVTTKSEVKEHHAISPESRPPCAPE